MSTLLTQLGQKVKTQLDTKLKTSGGSISGSLSIAQLLQIGTYTTSTLPTPSTIGRVVYVSDGEDGNPCVAVDNGTDWKILSLGNAIPAVIQLLTEASDSLTDEAGNLLIADY